LPVAPADAVTNDVLLAVVHEQFDGAVTVTSELPPPLFTFTFVDDSVTAHPVGAMDAAPACEKLTEAPFAVMLADRAAPVFAAML